MKKKEDIREVGRILGMISNGIHREMEKDQGLGEMEGLSCKNGWIIGYLSKHRQEPVYQKDLEKAFNVTRSTASKVIGLMEKKGLVERCSVEGDARLKEIRMTDAARSLADHMETRRLHMEARLTQGFTEEERVQLIGYLNRILDNIHDEKGGNID